MKNYCIYYNTKVGEFYFCSKERPLSFLLDLVIKDINHLIGASEEGAHILVIDGDEVSCDEEEGHKEIENLDKSQFVDKSISSLLDFFEKHKLSVKRFDFNVSDFHISNFENSLDVFIQFKDSKQPVNYFLERFKIDNSLEEEKFHFFLEGNHTIYDISDGIISFLFDNGEIIEEVTGEELDRY